MPRQAATELPKDGRDGRECPDCGAYLQWATIEGIQFRRCPWANPKTWRWVTEGFLYPEIYCQWPTTQRTPGGVTTVLSKNER